MTASMNRRDAILAGLALGASVLMAGCETPVEMQRLPDITFAHLPAFRFDVAEIQVISRFSPPGAAPHIEQRLPVPPEKAMRQWASDRLKAVGGAGTLRFVIEDASATETALALDTSLKGQFTKQQAQRYDLAVRALLVLVDAGGTERGTATALASRSITVREDVSLNERERTLFNVVDRLLADFNSEMETNIGRHLGRWLR